MILISAGLVLTAIVLLIAGFVLAKPFLVMWSIAVSVLSAVFLVIGALLRRHELFPGTPAGAAPPLPEKGPIPAGPVPAPYGMPNQPSAPPHMMAQHGMRQQMPAAPTQPRRGPVAGSPTATRRGALNAEAIVLVIPGRKRYHLAGCRQLAGRDHEELTHEEAREEGFTPCTTCLPEPTAGTQPHQTPPGVREPAEPLAASRDSGPFDGAAGPGPHEATSRFTSPYRPARPPVPSGGQQAPGTRPDVPHRPEAPQPKPQSRPEAPAAGRESVASRQEAASRHETPTSSPQEPVVPVARPYVQSPETQARPQEPVSPPLRAAESPTPSVPLRLPKIPEIPHAGSEATSWFSRDLVAQDSNPETPAAPARPEPGSEAAESAKSGPSGAPATAGTSAGRAEAPEAVKPGAARPEAAESEPVGPKLTSKSGSVEPDSDGSEPTAPEPAERDSAPSESSPSASAEPATSAPEEPEKPEAPDSGHQASAGGTTPEPVEPAETAPGRAGRQVAADSTTAEPAPDPEDRDPGTSSGGVSADEDREATGETVMVIIGTRRFHDLACPLIKGAGDSGTEVISLVEAEGAGLSSCSICLNDQQGQG